VTGRLIDDISDDGDLAMLAKLSHAAMLYVLFELSSLSLVECNDHCRRMALQLLQELGPHLSECEIGFCRSITAWIDGRRVSVKQIETLHTVARNAAARALGAARRARRDLQTVIPANALPA
jgi:hypothetical protein